MMTSVAPRLDLAGRYSVTETCRLLTIHKNTLRKLTDEGQIKCGFRKENARKFYLGSDIMALWRGRL